MTIDVPSLPAPKAASAGQGRQVDLIAQVGDDPYPRIVTILQGGTRVTVVQGRANLTAAALERFAHLDDAAPTDWEWLGSTACSDEYLQSHPDWSLSPGDISPSIVLWADGCRAVAVVRDMTGAVLAVHEYPPR